MLISDENERVKRGAIFMFKCVIEIHRKNLNILHYKDNLRKNNNILISALKKI